MSFINVWRSLLLGVLFISTTVSAQTWNWASQVAVFSSGGFGANKVRAIAVDANENVYVVGDYGDSALVGGTKVKAFGNGSEMFLAKYNSSGVLSWVKSIGSTGFLDQAVDITTDAAGDVYVLCSFFGNGLYDGNAIAPTTATVGLIKCNSSGVLQWAKVVPNSISGPAGIVAGFGHIYVAIGRTLIDYEPDGDTVWTREKPVNAAYTVAYNDVALDVWGCVYVTGQFKGNITYGSTTLTSANINDPDILTVKYDATGTVVWAKKAGAVSSLGQIDIGRAITTSQHGDVYVAGDFYGKAGFDSDSVSAGSAILGMFVVKYDNDGNVMWVKGSSGPLGATAYAYGVKTLANDDVLVSGYCGIGITVADTTINLSGGGDVLVMRLSAAGARRWIKRSDTPITSAFSYAMATNLGGTAAYVGGQFAVTVTFGPNTFNLASGVTDGWFGKMTLNTITDVREMTDLPLPQSFSLSQNYPNPFNPTTTIEFRIASASRVSVDIINMLGQKVRTLVDQNLSAGSYATEWDGVDDSGRKVASGVYLYRMKSGDFAETRKMTLLK